MGPFRFIILLLLFYILYRLLFKGRIVGGPKKTSSRFGSSSLPPRDILVEDPVCHTYVPKAHAVTLKEGAETLYFCSDKCYEAYLLKKKAGE